MYTYVYIYIYICIYIYIYIYIYPMACGRTRHRAKLIQWLNDSMINDSMINDSMIQWSMIQWLNDSMINAAAGSSRQRQTTGEDGCRCRGRCRRHSWLEKYPAFVGPFLAGYFSKFNIVSLHNRTKCNRNPKPMQKKKVLSNSSRPRPASPYNDLWSMKNDSMTKNQLINDSMTLMVQWSMIQ